MMTTDIPVPFYIPAGQPYYFNHFSLELLESCESYQFAGFTENTLKFRGTRGIIQREASISLFKQLHLTLPTGKLTVGIDPLKAYLLLKLLRIRVTINMLHQRRKTENHYKGSPEISFTRQKNNLAQLIFSEYCPPRQPFTATDVLDKQYPDWQKDRGSAAYWPERYSLILDAMVMDGDLTGNNACGYLATPKLISTLENSVASRILEIEARKSKRTEFYFKFASIIAAIIGAIAAIIGVADKLPATLRFLRITFGD